MEMPKDFATRMRGLAEDIPEQVVAGLLKKLLPKEPVKVRKPEGGWKLDPAQPKGFKTEHTGLKKVRKRKPRKALTKVKYTVVNPDAHLNHRYGTWTRAMVESVVEAWVDTPDSSPATSDAAQYMLSEIYPKYADRKIDWNWLAHDVGYIELV